MPAQNFSEFPHTENLQRVADWLIIGVSLMDPYTED